MYSRSDLQTSKTIVVLSIGATKKCPAFNLKKIKIINFVNRKRTRTPLSKNKKK